MFCLISSWHCYLLECADGSLYAGIATDVERRFWEHLTGKGARYTRSHKPVRLVASRPMGSRSEALRVERAIKRLPKGKKLAALLSPDLLANVATGFNPFNHIGRNHRMNKTELIEAAAEKAGLTKTATAQALDAILDVVVRTVAEGDGVTLVGFGTFKPSQRAARTGRNPQTGKELKIAATTTPRFTAGATFKTAVAGKKAAKKK